MELAGAARAAHSWQFIGESPHRLRSATGLKDIDADDVADVFIESGGSAFLVSGADMAGLDDDADGVIRLHGLVAAELLASDRLRSPGAAGGGRPPGR